MGLIYKKEVIVFPKGGADLRSFLVEMISTAVKEQTLYSSEFNGTRIEVNGEMIVDEYITRFHKARER